MRFGICAVPSDQLTVERTDRVLTNHESNSKYREILKHDNIKLYLFNNLTDITTDLNNWC